MSRIPQAILPVLLGSLALALSARGAITLPHTDVPQTAQTLGVLVIGVLLGWRKATVAVSVYLLLGACGLPVFAGGTSGIGKLFGPTGGFLLGFIVAAATAGWWVERGRAAAFPAAFLGMALAHLELLLLGWAWLAFSIGPAGAFTAGVRPFLLGGLIKTLVASVVAVVYTRWKQRKVRAPATT